MYVVVIIKHIRIKWYYKDRMNKGGDGKRLIAEKTKKKISYILNIIFKLNINKNSASPINLIIVFTIWYFLNTSFIL